MLYWVGPWDIQHFSNGFNKGPYILLFFKEFQRPTQYRLQNQSVTLEAWGWILEGTGFFLTPNPKALKAQRSSRLGDSGLLGLIVPLK